MDDPDTAVGQRIAELRAQKGMRQEDFLRLLDARGIEWTQATLSRIEGGKRALRATEAFAVADALAVDVSQLNPATSDLYYRIQQYRLRYREAKSAANRAVANMREIEERLLALMVAHEINQGRVKLTIHGTADDLISLLAQSVSQRPGGVYMPSEGAALIGIDHSLAERDYQDQVAEKYGPDEEPSDEDYAEFWDAAYARAFSRIYPDITFVGGDGAFAVEGMTPNADRLASDERFDLIWPPDGG
ncbi:helix-turn-helix domain-containing protein [Mycobacteroides abscessus subsp. abscessus]|uniref:helix-turn-helix domain-containing protein n=1 Tax=Mycobacteroides abscessus TaxID=36809 RepID=UPI00069902DA|nr:helix-turn-helix transcriptional regulator [Mycobacteroides abscessus]MDO3247973.1 helix-turn-helix domain-containing protein [Mycobacteroides abscessus subsp. abscessus]MDO3348713.1 helix-turn-helix domain-containing protein [Mycobacteroides abscessus subsp. abscessus]